MSAPPRSLVAAFATRVAQANKIAGQKLVSGERDTDNFLIVASINRSVCKSWMRPNDKTAGIAIDGIDEMGAADFFVFFGS